MKFKTYKGEMLTDVTVSYKIDGVRAHRVGDEIHSRQGKPLHNVPLLHDVCEVFLGSWEASVSACRTHNGTPIDPAFLYPLEPLDARLLRGTYAYLNAAVVKSMMDEATSLGYEGLVLKALVSGEAVYYKVKPVETFDVLVTEVIPGKGKHTGKMGALMTPMGKVGTGFSNAQRTNDYLGKIIEVEAMSLTPSGKFRHPRFKRLREDKS